MSEPRPGMTRMERLAQRRARQRRKMIRLSLVMLVVGVLVAVPIVIQLQRPEGPSADVVVERLANQQAIPSPEASASDSASAEPAEEAEPAEPRGPNVVPISQAEVLFVPIAQVTIPGIGVVAPVYSGVTDAVLELGVGHWPSTSRNIVLSGHRTTFQKPFHDLDLLEPGDRVLLGSQKGGDEHTYEVVETLIVPEAEYVGTVLQESDDHTLTLYACHPKGQRSHRIVVRARALDGPAVGEGGLSL
jgi:sortase A